MLWTRLNVIENTNRRDANEYGKVRPEMSVEYLSWNVEVYEDAETYIRAEHTVCIEVLAMDEQPE